MMIRRLAFVLFTLLTSVMAPAQPAQNYAFVRSREGVPVFGSGIRPTVGGNMGIPPGTPFYDTSTRQLYYWSGAAWTGTTVGDSIVFEGTTVDSNQLTVTTPEPTGGTATFWIPGTSGTAIINVGGNYEPGDAHSIWGDVSGLMFEGSSANGSETLLRAIDPTADRSIYLPDSTGT